MAAWIIQSLARFDVTPSMLTGIGLLLCIITALVTAQKGMFVGGLPILFAGIFDIFGGALACSRNTTTTFGAIVD